MNYLVCRGLLHVMFYILCVTCYVLHFMYYVLVITFFVLHIMYYILCVAFYVGPTSRFVQSLSRVELDSFKHSK